MPSYASKPIITDRSGRPRTVYRGESSGIHYESFDRRMTNAGVGFFFAEDYTQAERYAKAGSGVREFELCAGNLLDLTDPYTKTARAFIKEFEAEFEDWVDRRSGEPMSASEFLEAGALYDYEGTGSGHRWNALFIMAESMGFDAVRVLDSTDGASTGTAPVIVVFEPGQIQEIQDARNQTDDDTPGDCVRPVVC